MFSFIKKRLLYKFILVYIFDERVLVHTYDVKNFTIIESDAKEFALEKKDEFSDDLVKYIIALEESFTRSYVVTVVNSSGQGIIPTCSATKFIDYNVDRKYIYNICVDYLFTNFVSKIDIKWLQKIFSKTGIDFIFSPFTILKNISFFEQEREKVELHILYTMQNSTLLITKEGSYIFGAFFSQNNEKNPLFTDFDTENEDDSELIDSDEFEIEDDFDFENEDGFTFEIESNDNNSKENDLDYQSNIELVQNNREFTRELAKVLKEFYSKPIYESSFVDNVKIYSEEKIEDSLIEYIENELFLSVEVKSIDYDDEVLKLLYKEVI